MYREAGQLIYSPSDLMRFMESPFASWMERYLIEHPDCGIEPDPVDTLMSTLQAKGLKHEAALLAEFDSQGLTIAEITGSNTAAKVAATRQKMAEGVGVIFQACLELHPFRGYADFLIKVPGPSQLGDYHYEVWDTKLANHVKPYFVVQLCCYAEVIEQWQGVRPQTLTVALGNAEKAQLATRDYFYYYLSLKRSFLQRQSDFHTEHMPDPADSKSWGRWDNYAEQLLLERDHLFQIATITRSQIKKFNKAGIDTVRALIESDAKRIIGISPTVFQKLKAQATIQKASVGRDAPLFEVIVPNPGKKQGLALLPPTSKLDVFFDIEGYPLEDGGLEYLWGNTYFDENGQRQFIDFWAHNREQEKQCFQDFIGWVYARWQRDPGMHIYHYANYEIAACRKLMGRHGVCEHEVDQLLRNEVFVDLYKVVKGGILLGEPRYSIKNVEHLYRGKRETDVGNGGDSVVVYENWREQFEAEHPGEEPPLTVWQDYKDLNDIRDYNIDDCDSTQELVDWLREQQQSHNIPFAGRTEAEEPELSEEVTARTQLRDTLLMRAETETVAQTAQAGLTENLAWALEFHRREAKPVFWRLFDRLGLSHEELLDDLDCLAYCQRTETEAFKPTSGARNLAYEYRFDPNQEFKGANKSFYLLGEETEDGKPQKITYNSEHSDLAAGLIVVTAKEEPPAIISLVPDEYVNPNPIPLAIDAQVDAYAENTLGECAILDFLQRKSPRIMGRSIIGPGKEPGQGQGNEKEQPIVCSSDPDERLGQIINAIVNLDNSYLTIQGPPGAGKTFTGKHVIGELMKQGKRVGICSNSHKAINNLLLGAAKHCQKEQIHAEFACTKDTDRELLELDVAILKNNELANRVNTVCETGTVIGTVIGTTAWGFARDDMAEQLDYLFIDEAGQVSVANLIAISRATNNLVLMGDQMQLGQPAQGTHPAESGLSTLDYLLHDSPTIAEHMGVFLGTTYRMHSAVNRFISEAIYEGKLTSAQDNDHQLIAVPEGYNGPLHKEAGIVYIPVEHEGNTQASDEEVETILSQVEALMDRTFTDKDGNQRPIGWEDMLFVAPYNHQVNKLKQALEQLNGGEAAKVGSVDKFQGQEAPVVFLSMCASDAGESPRGIDFLFDKHRINVAISRAQSLAVVVGNPQLASTSANQLEQLAQVNLFAHLKEYAGA